MPQAHDEWKVLPHGSLQQFDESILTVVGNIHMPLTNLPRRMTIARLASGRLVVFGAIALDKPDMRTIENHGAPAFLVVPSEKHRLDARAWKERYPDVQVVAPAGSRGKIEDAVPVDTTLPDFDDPRVQFVTVPGTGRREAALVIHTRHGTTLVLDESTPLNWTTIDDRFALSAQFLEWAEMPALTRIFASHGEPIDDEPAEWLRDLAHSLEKARPEPMFRSTSRRAARPARGESERYSPRIFRT